MTDTNGNETVSRLPAPSFLPTVAVLEMTYRCNHSCLFCSCPWFAPDSGFDVRKELDVSQWKEAITMLCANGVTDIAFTGGEPLLKEGLTDIIKHAASCTALYIENKDGRANIRKAPPRLFLLSNGLIMNNSFLKLCKRHKIHLSLSLPGLKSFSYLTGQDNGA
ncbi:MAG: radical SAM protein, partial [bacterium]|nr:radical SAM protein [bacterium]